MKTLQHLLSALLLVSMTTMGASALTFTFTDKDFLSGASWGTMTVSTVDLNTLSVEYAASPSSIIPSGAEVTGFGFTFDTNPTALANPVDGAFLNDQDDLDWAILKNLPAIPQPANGDEFTPPVTDKSFFFGATEGNENSLTPPGILPGQYDLFYLDFTGVDFKAANFILEDFLTLTGVRIQSLPNTINGGSLFLVGNPDDDGGGQGNPVPEPGTFLLLGAGLIGLGLYRRKYKK